MPKGDARIEINGKLYDAETGRQIDAGQVEHDGQSKARGMVIDGFSAPHKVRSNSTSSANKLHAQRQKSKKLHSAAAKKPAPKVASSVANPAASAQQAKDKPAQWATSVDQQRAERAKKHAKSAHVSRFAANSPAMVASVSSTPTPLAVPPQAQAPAVQPAPKARKPKAEEPVEEVEKQPNWFKRLRERQPKLVPTVAGVAAFLLLAGYITYLNLPNMALRVAASRAGFDASLPGYKPAGFSFDGPIAYSPGQITIKFSSNSDERSFTLAQRESTWDSQSLLDNFLVRENKDPITFQEKGLTVYVYDDSNATWVDGGIWYTITGDSLLSSEQLLKIAGSL